MRHYGDTILRRLERQAVDLSKIGETEAAESVFEECKYAGVDAEGNLVKIPRWRIDEKWIEFECGCRAERCRDLADPRDWDPIIFSGLPEQAVYDYVCHTHNPSMNVRLMRHYVDFAQWHRYRRKQLMRKVA